MNTKKQMIEEIIRMASIIDENQLNLNNNIRNAIYRKIQKQDRYSLSILLMQLNQLDNNSIDLQNAFISKL